MMRVGLVYVSKYPPHPCLPIPKTGTATNTLNAKAAVVESEPVGGVYPGITVHMLHVATKRKSVPRNGKYF
jgi:hypothetical protein